MSISHLQTVSSFSKLSVSLEESMGESKDDSCNSDFCLLVSVRQSLTALSTFPSICNHQYYSLPTLNLFLEDNTETIFGHWLSKEKEPRDPMEQVYRSKLDHFTESSWSQPNKIQTSLPTSQHILSRYGCRKENTTLSRLCTLNISVNGKDTSYTNSCLKSILSFFTRRVIRVFHIDIDTKLFIFFLAKFKTVFILNAALPAEIYTVKPLGDLLPNAVHEKEPIRISLSDFFLNYGYSHPLIIKDILDNYIHLDFVSTLSYYQSLSVLFLFFLGRNILLENFKYQTKK